MYADFLLSQLAEQYGSDVAADILTRSRASAHTGSYMTSHGRYDSLGMRAPEGM